jgi:hypothetical protein
MQALLAAASAARCDASAARQPAASAPAAAAAAFAPRRSARRARASLHAAAAGAGSACSSRRRRVCAAAATSAPREFIGLEYDGEPPAYDETPSIEEELMAVSLGVRLRLRRACGVSEHTPAAALGANGCTRARTPGAQRRHAALPTACARAPPRAPCALLKRASIACGALCGLRCFATQPSHPAGCAFLGIAPRSRVPAFLYLPHAAEPGGGGGDARG